MGGWSVKTDRWTVAGRQTIVEGRSQVTWSDTVFRRWARTYVEELGEVEEEEELEKVGTSGSS